ncbi:MAG: PAS domain S-box protein [Dehalococcoidales bacterium]|nr:PAS domain S-box protein [Dehalococcoidales bacterium]
MPQAKRPEPGESLGDIIKKEMEYHSRRQVRRELRKVDRQPKQSDPLRGLFWGLLLVLLGILFFIKGREWLSDLGWWQAVVIGLGVIFIIDTIVHYINPSSRSYSFSRLIPGVILLFVGLAWIYGFNQWWPIALIATGIALFFSSWMLQREIEKRKITQNTLIQSEIKYRRIIDNANSFIIEMDTAGDITFINKFAQDFFGYKEEEIMEQNAVGTILQDTEKNRQEQENMMEDISIHPEKYVHNEKENTLRNGEKAWIVWTNKPIFDDNNKLKEILCIGIDSTEQKKAEALLAQQLKERTAIEERNRLARDLHDAVSQTLFSASLIAEVLPRLWERNPEEGRKRIGEIRELTRGALAEMRTLLLELRPVALKDAELGDLLRQLSESINGRARIPVKVDIEGQNNLPPEVKTALYRIAQEALNNVAKHSSASQAHVSLHYLSDEVRISIQDDGKGFDAEDIQAQSLGVGIMKERAREIGARLDIESQPGQGTTVTARWSMDFAQAE